MSKPLTVSVMRAYAAAYPTPLVVRAGERLTYDSADKANSERSENKWPEAVVYRRKRHSSLGARRLCKG
jgi:hypothetical protein